MLRLALHWQILIAVVLAAVTGIFLNINFSTRVSTTKLPNGKYLHVKDSTDKIIILLNNSRDWDASLPLSKRVIVDPTGRTPGSYITLSSLAEKDKTKKIHRLFVLHGRSTARWIGDIANGIGQLFLRMLKMVAVPLIITSLLTGVLGLANAGRLRKLFSMTIGYYIITSVLAIATGIFMVWIFQPGNRGSEEVAAQAESIVEDADLGETLYRQLEAMIPTNPFDAVVSSSFLSIIAFSLAFGIFTIIVGGRPLQLFKEFFESGFAVMMKMTMAIIHLAPIGVFCLMLSTTATQGADVFQALGWYLLTVFCALAFHSCITLPVIVHLAGRRNPAKYAHAMSPALMTAFSSASSNATLPLTLSCVENRAGIDNRVGSFVLPLGATINMDGTALFEVVAVLFIAQLEPTISLSLSDQIIVAFTALLASIGAAGIPHAGLVMMVIVLQAVGLPAERVGLILAVDRILDMCRTSVNVWSDSCGCAVVARFDGGDQAGATSDAPSTPEETKEEQTSPATSDGDWSVKKEGETTKTS